MCLTLGPEREAALEEFYQKWAHEPLVVLKWLSLKAGSNVPGNVQTAQALVAHSAFNIKNPNNCYSLFMAFCRSHPNFHAEDGSGYRFMADSIIEVFLLPSLQAFPFNVLPALTIILCTVYLLFGWGAAMPSQRMDVRSLSQCAVH